MLSLGFGVVDWESIPTQRVTSTVSLQAGTHELPTSDKSSQSTESKTKKEKENLQAQSLPRPSTMPPLDPTSSDGASANEPAVSPLLTSGYFPLPPSARHQPQHPPSLVIRPLQPPSLGSQPVRPRPFQFNTEGARGLQRATMEGGAQMQPIRQLGLRSPTISGP